MDLKRARVVDRLSCYRFLANHVRLLLHAPSTLPHTLRLRQVAAGTERLTLETLRLRLIKIGGLVRQLVTQVHLRLASHHLAKPLWRLLAAHGGDHE